MLFIYESRERVKQNYLALTTLTSANV